MTTPAPVNFSRPPVTEVVCGVGFPTTQGLADRSSSVSSGGAPLGPSLARPPEPWSPWLEQLTDAQATMPAALVRRLWASLLFHAGVPLQAPTAGPGGELAFYLAWRREGVDLDIDIAPDGRFEWFCADRVAGEAEGSEDERLTTPPAALIRRLVKDFHLR